MLKLGPSDDLKFFTSSTSLTGAPIYFKYDNEVYGIEGDRTFIIPSGSDIAFMNFDQAESYYIAVHGKKPGYNKEMYKWVESQRSGLKPVTEEEFRELYNKMVRFLEIGIKDNCISQMSSRSPEGSWRIDIRF